MNFGMLKNMVENIVSSYKCPFCSGTQISEKNIDIIGAAGNTVNIDMHCPGCEKHFMAKTEVMQMEVRNITPEKLSQIQKSLMALKGKLGGNLDISADILQDNAIQNNVEPSIQEKNILDLRDSMKQKGLNVKDLFLDTDTDLGTDSL